MSVQYASCESSIRACYPVMSQLRPHLQEAAFMAQVKRQMANHDYRLAYLLHEGQVAAVRVGLDQIDGDGPAEGWVDEKRTEEVDGTDVVQSDVNGAAEEALGLGVKSGVVGELDA